MLKCSLPPAFGEHPPPLVPSSVSPSLGNGCGMMTAAFEPSWMAIQLTELFLVPSAVSFVCVCVDVYLGLSTPEDLSYEAVVSARSRSVARTVCTTGTS